MPIGWRTTSGGPQYSLDGAEEDLEVRELDAQLFPAGGGDGVEARAAFGGGLAPLGLDPALFLEPLERRIERSLFDSEHVARQAPDVLGDAIPVQRPDAERLQDQHVERAGKQLGAFGAGVHSYTLSLSTSRLSMDRRLRAQVLWPHVAGASSVRKRSTSLCDDYICKPTPNSWLSAREAASSSIAKPSRSVWIS